MNSRLVSLATCLAAVTGALVWALPQLRQPTPIPPQVAMESMAMLAVVGGPERMLGTPMPAAMKVAPPPPRQNRFMLLGVIAPHHGGAAGLALISVDGQPAQVIAVGHEVEPGTQVLAVTHRQVELGAAAGAPTVTLELPALAEASRSGPAATTAPTKLAPGAQAPLTLHQLKELPLAVESSPDGEPTTTVAGRQRQ